MAGFLARFHLWRHRRAVIAAAISGQTEAIPRFLSADPDQGEWLLSLSRRRIELGARWEGALLSLGLIQAGNPGAIELIRLLDLKHRDRPHWKSWRARIVPEVTHCFLLYVWKHGTAEELASAYGLLATHQIVNHLEKVVGLLDTETPDDILTLLRPALGKAGTVRAWETLPGAVSNTLIRFVYRHGGSSDLEALFWALTPPQLLRVLRQVQRSPRPTCLGILMKLWWTYEEDIQLTLDDRIGEDLDPHLVAFVDILAVALGACAACDARYQNFAADEEHSAKFREIYAAHHRDIEEHNCLVEEFKQLGMGGVPSKLPAAQEQIVERIKELRETIRLSEMYIQDQERQNRHAMSPGFILERVLRNAQRYPTPVRQGATWGLYHLLVGGHLDRSAREQVFDLIAQTVSSVDAQDFGERRVQLPPDAETEDLVEALAAGLSWTLDLMEGVYGTWRTQWEAHLAARKPTALPEDGPSPATGEEPSTLAATTEDASGGKSVSTREEASEIPVPEREGTPGERLALFEQILASGSSDISARYPALEEIVGLLRNLMPGALAFLERYPLRLMRLDHHRRLFGQYSKVGAHVTLWTRYTPPKEVGPVRRRFLTLDDRTRPNSMGIYYELFRHPLLALPVIYHEFLHYGGPTGNPSMGIENETEVLLREILFARHLIACLAPDEDDQLLTYESEIAEELRVVKLHSLLVQLSCDLGDPKVLAQINHAILDTYGGQKSVDEAELLSTVEIQKTNMFIYLENLTQTWQKDVPWPLLGSVDTESLTERYRELLKHRYMLDHSVDSSHRDRILADQSSRIFQADWQAYLRRPRAMQALRGAGERDAFLQLALPQLLELLVQRFPGAASLGISQSAPTDPWAF